MLWYNTFALSLAVTWKALGALRIVEQRYEHKWKKICVQYPWGKGFLTVSWCYHQSEPHLCLLNGMGISHPAFPYSSSPAGNSVRGLLFLLPQEQNIHSGMKKNNVGSSAACPLPPFLSCCFWTPWPFQRQLSNPLHLLSNWIANLETLQWEQAIHFNSVSLLSLPWDQGRSWGNAVSICWLSLLMGLTSGLARSQSCGPSCVWASQGSVTRQNKTSETLHTTRGQWLTLPAALEKQTCQAELTIRKNKERAGSQFWTSYRPTYLPTYPPSYVWQELFWQEHPSVNCLSAEEPWKMDCQWEEHHELQHVLQGITVPWSYSALILRKPAQTTDPGSVSLLGVTNFPLTARGEGSEGEVRVGHRSVETIQIKKKPLAFQVSLY